MKKIISVLCITTILTNVTACGTILYPERKGQSSGQIDVGVALLDGVGLLCFLIPGVIAYAVDFSNGTIYMPHGGGKKHSSIEGFNPREMKAINVGKENLTPEKIRKIVSAGVGSDVDTGSAQAYKFGVNGERVRVDSKVFAGIQG